MIAMAAYTNKINCLRKWAPSLPSELEVLVVFSLRI